MNSFNLYSASLFSLLVILTTGCFQGSSPSESTAPETTAPAAEPASAPSASAAPEETVTGQASAAEVYQQALEMGMRAANAAQTAASASDWELVHQRWQMAIRILQAIPDGSEQYATAQEKIQEYQSYAAVAQQRQDALTQVSSAAPAATTSATTARSTHPLCQGAIPRGNTVVLSNFQFETDEFSGEDYLVGCATNHSNRTVTLESISYSTQGGGSFGGGTARLDMPQRTLARGESQPWRSGFSFDENDEIIELGRLTVTWEDGQREAIDLERTINH